MVLQSPTNVSHVTLRDIVIKATTSL